MAITKLVEHKIKEANTIEQKKPWTGKIICIKDSIYFKKGRIYKCKDGILDISEDLGFNIMPYYSFDDLVHKVRLMTNADFIEYVE